MMKKKTGVFLLAVLMAGMLQACGHSPDAEAPEVKDVGMDDAAEEQEGDRKTEEDPQAGPGDTEADSGGAAGGPEMNADEASGLGKWKQQFGEDCIAEQTFEVELSEYSGKVCFVPYAPSEDGQDLHMQIVQDGKVLTDLPDYVPEVLSGKPFGSLDAVSFYDINYDGATDILLIETYGDTGFAAVYYGYAEEGAGIGGYFVPQEQLSENITGQAQTLTVPAIRELLSGGKKNGEYADYREAYDAASRLCELEGAEDRTYDLVYVDEDEIPELVAGVNGYYVSLYTFRDGKIYTLMDRWPYGVMGNVGYEYAPRKNNLRNYNNDYAGAILYTTYMKVNDRHAIETTMEIRTVNFDDANQNGVPDEEEMGSFGMYGVSYIDGKEVSAEECASYDAGDYEMLVGTMSLKELQEALKK